MLKNKPKLLKLYLSYHINKVFFVVLFSILVLWVGILFINSNYPFEMDDYIKYTEYFHEYYYQQSFFFLNIINVSIVAYLISNEISSETQFDPLFVSFVSRNKIVINKFLANLIILIFIVSYEIVLMNVIGTFIFPNFRYDFHELLLIPYSLIPLIALLLIGKFLALFIKSNLLSVLIVVIHIIFSILIQNNDIYKYVIYIIPQIKFIDVICPVLEGNIICYFCFLSVMFCSILMIYQKKDIKM